MLIIFFCAIVLGIYSHERSHQETFKHYGCEGYITLNLKEQSFTPYPCKLTPDERLNLIQTNNLIDSNYENIRFDYYFLIIIIYLILLYKKNEA